MVNGRALPPGCTVVIRGEQMAPADNRVVRGCTAAWALHALQCKGCAVAPSCMGRSAADAGLHQAAARAWVSTHQAAPGVCRSPAPCAPPHTLALRRLCLPQVRMGFAARAIPKRDKMSESDPFLQVGGGRVKGG